MEDRACSQRGVTAPPPGRRTRPAARVHSAIARLENRGRRRGSQRHREAGGPGVHQGLTAPPRGRRTRAAARCHSATARSEDRSCSRRSQRHPEARGPDLQLGM
ncbi:hypothetical protein chiPu_0024046 [Chiloscyllium punctatum]|uniref:Uncharacterized protein n=1 Tax=Chiloscyllium punctatum TaxID=137246 RepID=A0A401TC98_CHIPU|nr:hypothetical protein [Chiloscyllium punctatum]